MKHLERIVVDASFTGMKKQGLLEMPDTEKAFSKQLARVELRERLRRDDEAVTTVLVF